MWPTPPDPISSEPQRPVVHSKMSLVRALVRFLQAAWGAVRWSWVELFDWKGSFISTKRSSANFDTLNSRGFWNLIRLLRNFSFSEQLFAFGTRNKNHRFLHKLPLAVFIYYWEPSARTARRNFTQLYAHGRGAGSKTRNNSRFSDIRVVYDKKQPDDPHRFPVGHCKYKNRIPYRFLVLGSMRYYLQGLLAIPRVILDCEWTPLVYP